MRVLFKDENGNLTILEANGLDKGSDKQPVVAITVKNGPAPMICDDPKLYKEFNQILKTNINNPSIDLSEYTFKTLSIGNMVSSMSEVNLIFGDED
jgi:hypothetical protein